MLPRRQYKIIKCINFEWQDCFIYRNLIYNSISNTFVTYAVYYITTDKKKIKYLSIIWKYLVDAVKPKYFYTDLKGNLYFLRVI